MWTPRWYSDYSFEVMHTVDKIIDNSKVDKIIDNSKIIFEIDTSNSVIDDTI